MIDTAKNYTSFSNDVVEKSAHYNVVIVGAGPYGLSIAAHLLPHNLSVAIFGKPFGFWHDCIPQDMILRSKWFATTLSDAAGRYSFAEYLQKHNIAPPEATPTALLLDYFSWFQRHTVPVVDETFVSSIRRRDGQFLVELVDGRVVTAEQVVMATGMADYAYYPPEYEHLNSNLCSHTVEHSSFERFAGQRVAVIGGGQSAVETAVALAESGARPHLITRKVVKWLKMPVDGDCAPAKVQRRSFWQRLRYPYARLSPGLFNWWIENFPYAFYHLPLFLKQRLFATKGGYPPAAHYRLRERMNMSVTLHQRCSVEKILHDDMNVVLCLSQENGDDSHAYKNKQVVEVDHVILGTGYRVDLRKNKLLDSELLSSIKTDEQYYPVLNHYFESSVPGLYFVGLPAVANFGPLYRFIIGAEFAAKRITKALAKKVGV